MCPGERCANGTVNQNVLPVPASLSTPIVPPIKPTRRRAMASPSPVPPNRRLVEPSAWVNGSNRRSRASGAMPMPVSVTAKVTRGEG